ncbi:MAG: saccharopine dehydrogenase NADP-binding domain-containing protein [Blastocatellia bacterium]|nr:saccharopine dehydrogenase NADP-binding domain-containing protein [Blastocatellia bacterium]
MADRDYDVVLYGASGFTGKQTVAYFARHASASGLRWAIAGRNREKLEGVRAQVGGAAAKVDVLVADSRDQAAVDAVVGRTRVLLTTAGPYAIYGGPLVEACVRFRTHYVDITGETPWVRELIDRHHEAAAAAGTRIIPFCGFDSVPSDLGAYLIVRHMQRELGVSCKAVKAWYQVMGGLNGGTMATVYNLQETGLTERARDPFLLDPPGISHTAAELAHNQDPALPFYDADLQAWAGPFFMGQINTRVVRRSEALFRQWGEAYGPSFAYQEYMKFNGPLGWAEAAGMTVGAALFQFSLQTPLRELMKSMLPEPGAGPSEKTMDNGWFRCELLGIAEDGRKVRGLIRDQGDPGNRATVKILCESALALALNADRLPGGSARGGVLTPATGLGDALAARLRDAGMTIEMGQ